MRRSEQPQKRMLREALKDGGWGLGLGFDMTSDQCFCRRACIWLMCKAETPQLAHLDIEWRIIVVRLHAVSLQSASGQQL